MDLTNKYNQHKLSSSWLTIPTFSEKQVVTPLIYFGQPQVAPAVSVTAYSVISIFPVGKFRLADITVDAWIMRNNKQKSTSNSFDFTASSSQLTTLAVKSFTCDRYWSRSFLACCNSNQPKLKRESADRMMVWRRGTPISQALTLAANRSEHSDSPNEEGSGEMFTNISVFESPPRHGWMKIVLERVRTYNDLKDQKKRKNEVRIKDSSWK